MKALEFKEATINFGPKDIFRNLNLSISEGEFVGIFGPNGAGKTSLMRSILGLIRPTSGNILVMGKPAHRGDQRIGYLAQIHHDTQSFPLTGRTYMSSALTGCGWGLPFLSKEHLCEIERVIELVDLQDYIDRPFSQFSGGEKQRLLLAEALLGNPPILLLDEPLSSLDPGQQEKIIDLIQVIQSQLHITVLFSAHNINPLLDVMTRLIYLAHGKAIIGTVAEIVNSETLSRLYDTPIEILKSGDNILVINKKSGTSIHNEHHQQHHGFHH